MPCGISWAVRTDAGAHPRTRIVLKASTCDTRSSSAGPPSPSTGSRGLHGCQRHERRCENPNGQPPTRPSRAVDRGVGRAAAGRLRRLAESGAEAADAGGCAADRHGCPGDAGRHAGDPERAGHRHAHRHGHRHAQPGGQRLSDRGALPGRAGRREGPGPGADRSAAVPGGPRPGDRHAAARPGHPARGADGPRCASRSSSSWIRSRASRPKTRPTSSSRTRAR